MAIKIMLFHVVSNRCYYVFFVLVDVTELHLKLHHLAAPSPGMLPS
jgi:hypothetical protein